MVIYEAGSGRRHLAKVWYNRNGAWLKCKAKDCDWAADQSLTVVQQREQHRQHRRDNGERVKDTLKTQTHDRIKLIKEMHSPDGDDAETCPVCGVFSPCKTYLIADGEIVEDD